MLKYSKDFKEQALRLSDELGEKKAAKQLRISYYTIADWGKVRRGRKNSIGQNTVERAGACHAARNTGGEKSRV